MFIMYHYASVCCSSRFILVVYVFILVHLCFICVFARGQSAGDLAGSSSQSPHADAATNSSSAAADIVEGPTATTASGTFEGYGNCEGHTSTTASRPCRQSQDVEEEEPDGIASRLKRLLTVSCIWRNI